MLQIARKVLVFLKVANWVVGVAFILILGFGALFASDQVMAGVAKNHDGVDPAAFLTFIRISILFMITVIALCHVMFRSLIEMIDTVASDKVFTDANANRLRSIAWALLGFCVVEHIYGFLALHYVPPLVEWSPTLTGWLVSLMLFVLASVWQQGVAMREDLEGTV